MQYSTQTSFSLGKNKSASTSYDDIIVALAEHAHEALKSIDARAEELEEAFLNIVYYLFNKHNINRDEKIVISLTENGYLQTNSHPQQEEILSLLDSTPQCLKIMQRLASDAMLKRGIQNIQNSQSIISGNPINSQAVYQTSIKGELSHFYLI